MIEVFRTNVCEEIQASEIIALLQQHFPGSKINFDLEDCDKVLRVEADHILPYPVSKLLHSHGHLCEVLA
ncbi:MAG: hypothetical protein K0Q79_2675 [Flavipsychrobacter sp.]|jgi:hypothetical protein|nr:hypothetical protein [Flavipsychrobacter sp.]